MKSLILLISVLGGCTYFSQTQTHLSFDQLKADSSDKYSFIYQTSSGVIFSNAKNSFLLDRNNQWIELNPDNTPYTQVEGSVYILNLDTYKNHVLVTSYVDIADRPKFSPETGAQVVNDNGIPIYEDGGYLQESGIWNLKSKNWLIKPDNLSVEFSNKQYTTKRIVANTRDEYSFLISRGELFIERGEFEQAQKLFNDAHEVSPDKYETTNTYQAGLDSLQITSLKSENFLQIIKYLEAIEKTALDCNYNKSLQLIEKGKNLFNSPEELIKIESLVKDLQKDSSNEQTKANITQLKYNSYIRLGDSYASFNGYEKAIKYYSQAKELSPEKKEVYAKIETCNESLKLYNEKYSKFLNLHYQYKIEITTYSNKGKLLTRQTVKGKKEVTEEIQQLFK